MPKISGGSFGICFFFLQKLVMFRFHLFFIDMSSFFLGNHSQLGIARSQATQERMAVL